MSIDLKNYENLCKDERQKIIVSRDDDEKNSGKGGKCEHCALNKSQSLVRQYKVDGNIFVTVKNVIF